MAKQFFYGRAKVRSNIKMDLDTGNTLVVFSTQKRPVGTKVEDPEEGTLGNNSAEHSPPTHVTLYLCPGGTGAADEADPLTSWGLIDTANAIADGTLQVIANGYLLKEWSVRKGDSEGGESVERRFSVELSTKFHTPIYDQGLGVLSRHSAAMTLAVLETQPEFDDMPEPNPKPKRRAKKDHSDGQANLFSAAEPEPHATTTAVLTLGSEGMAIEFPEQEPQEPGEVPPTWDFSTFSTAKLLRVLEGGAGTPDYMAAVKAELDARPVETPDAAQDLLDAADENPTPPAILPEEAESMIERASKAKRRK